MNPITRGVRNAFRNTVRTGSIVAILGLSIGLALTMLVAQKAVDNKIKSVKSSIGTTVTIAPAGFNPGSSANNALTGTLLAKVKSLPHVASLSETLSDRLPTTGATMPSFGRFGGGSSSDSGSTTSLSSPVTLNTNGNGGSRFFVNGGDGTLPTNFSLPVSFLGTTDPSTVDGSAITLSSGKTIDGTTAANNALISTQMASKNNLAVGNTFTAYGTTLTVSGIFTTSTQSAQGTVIVSLPTLQQLSGQSDVVTNAAATADSLDNLSGVTTAIKNTLGSNADVTSAQQQADDTVGPLNSVKTVATFSLIGAMAAGAVIILLTMIMVVRERKREIGVVKAIGGSNLRIMLEFMAESLTLAVLGAVIGLIIGVVGGQPVTKMLVKNSTNTDTATTQTTTAPDVAGGTGRRFGGEGQGRAFATRFNQGFRRNGAVQGISTIKTEVGPSILLDGFGAAVLIALIGSALAAGMIAKVRPSTVMRAE